MLSCSIFVDTRNRFQLVTGRTWRGSAFGGVKGRTELPGLVEGLIDCIGIEYMADHLHSDYLAGKVRVDEYVTHHRKFEEINEGFQDMHVRGCDFYASIQALTFLKGWRLHPMRRRHVLRMKNKKQKCTIRCGN